MNRRHFLTGAIVAAAAALPVAAMAEAKKSEGLRLTVSNPPEPGFTYVNGRRYRVFCDGKPVDLCVRVDTGEGRAWHMYRERLGKGGGPTLSYEREIRGSIRLERIA